MNEQLVAGENIRAGEAVRIGKHGLVLRYVPKEYDFAEAYQMMKAGKWMKPVDSMDCRAKIGDKWFIKQVGCAVTYGCDRIPIDLPDSKWIEVQP